MKRVNPAKGWHHVSVRDPKKFPIVATIQLGRKAEATDRSDFGIQARIGREKGKKKGGTKFVTLLFDPRLWTLDQAKKWAKDHGEKVMEAIEAPDRPDYELSGRAHAIGHSRHEAEEMKARRKDLLETGVGFEVSNFRKICELVLSDHETDAATAKVMKVGHFTDKKRDILVIPRDAEIADGVCEAISRALVRLLKRKEVDGDLRMEIGALTERICLWQESVADDARPKR